MKHLIISCNIGEMQRKLNLNESDRSLVFDAVEVEVHLIHYMFSVQTHVAVGLDHRFTRLHQQSLDLNILRTQHEHFSKTTPLTLVGAIF